MVKNKTKENIGFVFEVFGFILTGMLISIGFIFESMFVFLTSIGLALWTGKKIKENALEDYKNGHK